MIQQQTRTTQKALMSPEEWENNLQRQTDLNAELLIINAELLGEEVPQHPYVYRHLSPKAFGIMDALDQFKCVPSAYYRICQRRERIEYIAGFLSVKSEDRCARQLGRCYGLRLSEQQLSDLYDELQAEDEYVDECQSEYVDWQS